VVALLWVLVRGGRSGVIAGHAWAVPSGPDAVQVEVLNGTGKQGLARVGARVLRRRGIDVMLFANADSVIDSTRIIVRRGDGSRGETIRKALGAGKISTALDTLRRVDATVILGTDFRGPIEVHP
jgi:hypothetical protein